MKRSHYEITAILRPEGSPETIRQFAERVDEIIRQYEGTVLSLQSWGERKLAYEIKKATEAYYTFITFEAPETAPALIESDIRIMEQVLRFLIVKQEA